MIHRSLHEYAFMASVFEMIPMAHFANFFTYLRVDYMNKVECSH